MTHWQTESPGTCKPPLYEHAKVFRKGAKLVAVKEAVFGVTVTFILGNDI